MASRLPKPPATRSSARTKPSVNASTETPPAPATRARTTRATSAARAAAEPTASSTRRTKAAAAPATTATVPKQSRIAKSVDPNPAKGRARGKVGAKEDVSQLPVQSSTPSLVPVPTLANKASVLALKDLPPDDREPIKVCAVLSTVSGPSAHPKFFQAFLRIRPPPSAEEKSTDSPYLTFLSTTDVQMTTPTQTSTSISRLRAPTPSRSTYKFTQVFPHTTLQPEFFTHTALPMVRSLLSGENGLIFAYGVTNSGKTYTIQGGKGPSDAGLLPRTLDVIFNSVEGLHSEAPVSFNSK